MEHWTTGELTNNFQKLSFRSKEHNSVLPLWEVEKSIGS